jgi:hypothetical protein
MRSKYLVYPSASEKIEKAGLKERILKAVKKEDFPFLGGCTFESDVASTVSAMEEEGFFKTFPAEFRGEWQKQLNAVFRKREKYPWKAHRNGRVVEEETELEDVELMMGWTASFVLKPEEIWDFKKFGFASLPDFVGSFGAEVYSLYHEKSGDFRGGYKWETNVNGRRFINEITGDMNLDLRVLQTDITPDRTIDPCGYEVSYRPEFRADWQCVAAYHSTEPEFLIGVLRWIEQQKLHPEILKDKAKPLLQYVGSLETLTGHATECLSGYSGPYTPRVLLCTFDIPIPVLNEHNSTAQRTTYFLGCQSDGYFGMYVSPQGELVFAYENPKEIEPTKNVSARFQPDDANNLLRGIMFQAAKGLGRTLPERLVEIVNYRYSDEFGKEKK